MRHDLDRAETLYRRAIDLEPSNDKVLENFLRLQRERTPEGIYHKAGPSKIAVWHAQVEIESYRLKCVLTFENDIRKYDVTQIRTGEKWWI